MRRERRMPNRGEENRLNKMLYISGSILALAIIAFVVTFTMYGNKLKNNSESSLTTEKIADLVPSISEEDDNTESTSTEIGKTVEESKNELENNNINNVVTKNTTVDNNSTNTTKNNTKTTSSKTTKSNKKESTKATKTPDPTFSKPVEGEIIREFAKDSLVFSNTLQEWIIHEGIDIKADKTTVVKAAESGTVKSIKNDPRYGITVIIEHTNGYKTIYSNLLTSEFVVENEKVEKGQTIGTVGNTAVFESADDYHLHFEIWKDNVAQDPTIYLK